MHKLTNNRRVGRVAVLLAGFVVIGTALLSILPRAYWVAKYAGREANLHGADLHKAFLGQARLCGADLREADLYGAYLCDADLSGAELRHADLSGVKLASTGFGSARLNGADLRGASLSGMRMRDTFYDAHTRWPAGFDPTRHGAVKAK